MRPLFKYLPAPYVDTLLAGNILFRNLVYFRLVEGDVRHDALEGTHVDKPDHNVEMLNLTTAMTIRGRFAFHNAAKNFDRIFCFCTSLCFDPALLTKFGGSCIEIFDSDAFERRLFDALRRRSGLIPLESPLLLAKPVIYYRSNQAAPDGVDVTDPRHLAFLKPHEFENEQEFRFMFGRRGAFELKRMIVNDLYSPKEELIGKAEKAAVIKMGSITDLAKVRTV